METKKLITSTNIMYPSLYIDGHHNHESFITNKTEYLEQLPKELLRNSLVIYSILILSMFKEEVLEKTETKEIILNIPDEHLGTLLGNLVQPDGDKYKIGELSFEDKKEILETLRNKLLHGDYYIEGEKVVIIKEGFEGYIDSKDLFKMCALFIPVLYFKKTGPQYRPMTLYKDPKTKATDDITTIKDLKRFMREVIFYNMKDEPEAGYERTNEYAMALNDFYNDLNTNKELMMKYSIDNYVQVIYQKHKTELKKHHVTIECKGIPVTDTEQFQKLKDFFVNCYDQFGNFPPLFKRELLLSQASNMLQVDGSDHLITSGAIMNDMIYLLNYLKDETLDIRRLHRNQSNMYPDDMTIAHSFSLFYSMYHYELDEIYSNGKLTKLEEVVNGTYLNFALLDLSKLDCPTMEIDVPFQDFKPQLTSMLKEVVDKYPGLEKLKENYINYSKKTDKKPEVEAKIKGIYDKADKEFMDRMWFVNACCKFMDNQFEKYVKNFNIISHIRNAFAHGNVRILPYVKGDPLLDRDIAISDIYEGRDTYSIVIKYKDFRQLMEESNLRYIMLFLDYKLKSTPEIKEAYEKAMDEAKDKGVALILKDE